MLSLEEYLKITQKVIIKFCGKGLLSKKLLRDDDAISFVAEALMMADWKYDPTRGKTRYSYRNQRAIWAIKKYFHKLKETKSIKSLNYPVHNRNGKDKIELGDLIIDQKTLSPDQNIQTNEKIHQARRMIEMSYLDPAQKMCIEMKYLHGLSVNEIQAKLGISRQAVCANLQRGILTMKQTFGSCGGY
jgi:RNA polymerase sigma factor (sigma-70 family)